MRKEEEKKKEGEKAIFHQEKSETQGPHSLAKQRPLNPPL
jgi:hypothetical protein